MKKIILSVLGIIALVAGLVIFILNNVRIEFENHLKNTYPNNTFYVEFPKINIIYGSFYSDVFCINDSVTFVMGKSWRDKKISESYGSIKKQERTTAELEEIFSGSGAEKYIGHISGGSKLVSNENETYDNIYLGIEPDVDMVRATKEIFDLLKEKNIRISEIFIRYEEANGVYEGHFSDRDYDLTEGEIERAIVRIK